MSSTLRSASILGLLLAAASTAVAAPLPASLLQPRQGALAGVNDALSNAGSSAIGKAKHHTKGLNTVQLSVLIGVLLLVLALGCFGLWYCCGARTQRRNARAAAAAAASDDAQAPMAASAGSRKEEWTRFKNSSVDSTTELTKA